MLQELIVAAEGKSWQERLALLGGFAQAKIVFSTSFSFEDQAILAEIAVQKLPIRIFTLDTGRLFEETHTVHQQSREKYGHPIEIYYPDAQAIQHFVQAQGINGFYDSLENRKACCHIRKVEPLQRALKGADIWISGLRHEDSELRANLPVAEWDAGNNVIKYYPLLDATGEELWAYIKEKRVPYNILHDKNYPSIGCAPCTRAVLPGEHPRSGRWWWEQGNATECGLHVVDGKLVRINK